MRIKIRDWDSNFEADRSRTWKKLSWVPIPNKIGLGYIKIMKQGKKDGPAIFGCWIALVEQASLCSPRGDLTKYTIADLSDKTMIDEQMLISAIDFISKNLNWIEIVDEALTSIDENVKKCHQTGQEVSLTDSILYSSLSCNSSEEPEKIEEKKKYLDFVFLTDAEHGRLLSEFGKDFVEACIFKLNTYLVNNPKKQPGKKSCYVNHNLVIRDWVVDSVKEKMTPCPEQAAPTKESALAAAQKKLDTAIQAHDHAVSAGEPPHRLQILRLDIEAAREERDEAAGKA